MSHLILVLGAQNSETGMLDANATARIEAAFQAYRSDSAAKLAVSGRRGAHFNVSPRPHLAWMAEHLIRLGVPVEEIIGGVLSGNTVEDAFFAGDLIRVHAVSRLTIVTSRYHMVRASLIFRSVYPGLELETVASADLLSPAMLERRHAHEEQALAQLVRQRGVIWQGGLFPLRPDLRT